MNTFYEVILIIINVKFTELINGFLTFDLISMIIINNYGIQNDFN